MMSLDDSPKNDVFINDSFKEINLPPLFHKVFYNPHNHQKRDDSCEKQNQTPKHFKAVIPSSIISIEALIVLFPSNTL